MEVMKQIISSLSRKCLYREVHAVCRLWYQRWFRRNDFLWPNMGMVCLSRANDASEDLHNCLRVSLRQHCYWIEWIPILSGFDCGVPELRVEITVSPRQKSCQARVWKRRWSYFVSLNFPAFHSVDVLLRFKKQKSCFAAGVFHSPFFS